MGEEAISSVKRDARSSIADVIKHWLIVVRAAATQNCCREAEAAICYGDLSNKKTFCAEKNASSHISC
jgi:hypothetical protein